MAVPKDRIYVGNTYSIAFECFEPDTNANNYVKVPKSADTAIVELWSVATQAYIQLGASTLWDSATVTGNLVEYTVPAAKLGVEGEYKLFLTITFPDGQIATTPRVFKVQTRT